MSASPGVVSGEFAGRYTIERELGRGATSIVWLARDRDFSRMVALKILRDELMTELTAERFLREVRVTAQLHHPNVVPVLNSGEFGGRLFFVLPYMDGGTLRARLQRDKQLPIAEVIEIGKSIASALASAHERNVLHRDVKPENILFTGGQACLADFGIARAIIQMTGESTTSTGLVRGTPAYMSPEQASGDQDYDGRSDLYSLACVLYEALAGVPAFVGASAQQIVAQRLLHPPRPVRVYRPTVSPELEEMLEKALATSPADRFQNAKEFEAALVAAPLTSTGGSRNAGRSHRIRNLALAAAGVATLAAAAAISSHFVISSTEFVGDTTQIALLPVEGDDPDRSTQVYEAMYQGLGRWRDVSTTDAFKVREAVRRVGGVSSETDARRVASSLGAGRFVRGRITRDGSAWRAYAGLYDTKSGRRLSEASVAFEDGQSADRTRMMDLSDSLVLQGIDPATVGSRSLSAIQEHSQAMRAISGEWNLRRADSLLTKAAERDPDFPQASLWLAEVRSASGRPSASWRAVAERAHAQVRGSRRDSALANALVALANADFSRACREFDAMRLENQTNFIALYGLGQCRSQDSIVVPDPASPSGWSFRSSRFRAAEWFARAFKAAPYLHRGLSAGGYRQLRMQLLAVDRQAIGGLALTPDTTRFLARPEWRGDSVELVPYPKEVVAAGRARFDPQAGAAATRHQLAVVLDIARSWSFALPNNAGAKEALAMALGVSGDAASVDTMRVARRLEADNIARIRLAAEDVMLRLEFARLTDSTDLRSIRVLADSLLRDQQSATGDVAGTLSTIAALLGRCTMAGHLAARARAINDSRAAIDSITVLMAAGCPARIPDELVDQWITTRTTGSNLPAKPPSRMRLEYDLVGRAISLAFATDSARVRRLADSTEDYLLRAERAAIDRDAGAVSAILLRQQTRRDGSAQGVSPDARTAEATVWLAVGDTARAIAWLDPVLTRPGWVLSVPYETVSVASMMRSLALRLELAVRSRDAKILNTWSPVLRVLWATADPPLRDLVGELRPRL